MSPTAYYGAWLALGMIGVVAGLVYWQWADRRGRGEDLSDEDRSHFTRQDWRRGVVALLMAIVAVGVYVGSTLPSLANGRPNLTFVAIWLGIFILILVLVVLALFDWLATQRYARRHRDAIVREGMRVFHDEIRLQIGPDPVREPPAGTNGSAGSIP